MSDQNSPHQSNNSLDEILKELEERFGVNTNHEEKNSDPKKSKGINFKRFGQNQVIGGLTLMLLIVGAGVGMFLGSQTTENRQRAAVPYDSCISGPAACIGHGDGSPCGSANGHCLLNAADGSCSCSDNTVATCKENCLTANPGNASFCNTLRGCTEPECPGQPAGSFCAEPGGSCGGLGYVLRSDGCEAVGGVSCCPPGGGGVSSTPTKTPTPTLLVTNTPGQPTTGPATNTPGQPTSIPATNTPTKSPTPTTVIGPTCNGIKITFGGVNEPNRDVRIGDNITLNCGTANGAFRYEFRLYLNGVLLPPINPISSSASVSQPFPIAQSGNYSAQCRMCTDNTATSCQSWEPL